MTATVGQDAPTKHRELLEWVEEVAALTKPDAIRWCDGSDAEWKEFTDALVERGVATRLNDEAKPNSFYFRSSPADVARVEDRTYICTETEQGAGPTNNWVAPAEMKQTMTELYDGSMKGRTMYVVPFCMGPIDADDPKFGVEITDSEYVVISMKIMTRMGTQALEAMGTDKPFVKCLHSVGAPLADGQEDVAWPCNETKYISHFPETREIWSYGSGYGGNALLGKKCYALRIASAMAHDEGWLAEHMLILELTSPENKKYVICAAFPSACGKTNLAMLEPTIPGWTVKTLGDDIAWMRFGEDGRLYAVNPENGFFGVAPGTGYQTNPNAMRTIEKGNSIFTNVALTDHGDVWWEGMTPTKPEHLTDWHGNSWTPESDAPAAHPNSRFTTPIDQSPILSEDFNNPKGVPVDAILFGGRRATTVPLVAQSRDWNHGTFMGATCSSETTAAATGAVGVVRRDPMAMLPFIGYNANDYLQHWINVGEQGGDKMPAIFYVNWFRKSDEGKFLWPGFGDNSRVLEWVINRLEGTAEAVDTPIGAIPAPGSLNVEGLSIDEADLDAATRVDTEEWQRELPLIEEWFAKLGDVPQALRDELDGLKKRLG
ncbi:phosphoenolpyruvate carboxykinase (GTP) [Propionibacteriaceae bacterium ES.041]|uniref:phosphoenolpyruvate carboxykinase (GTP) n=1 Tax=Enemella evansiae TaxID=2016499 RepID=UPI000B975C7F|nr:phosphoenolpyruvate carboxykinase (GTP) [Enemella evansiae]OYN96377.1 phosphoenolpyruvate carboxykinase (GTP) [Enemella evansiae]PFG65626.1 phosphoenolpyruvate carboxykinase (GTP) [Propionibacteriaceae bacterium ES.041]